MVVINSEHAEVVQEACPGNYKWPKICTDLYKAIHEHQVLESPLWIPLPVDLWRLVKEVHHGLASNL